MNKFKKTSGLSALAFLLVSFLLTPVGAAIAGQAENGIIKAQFCDVVMAAEEKGKGKDGKEEEEEPDCE